MNEDGYHPMKSVVSMFLIVLVAFSLIVGLLGFANTVAPLDELHQMHQRERE